MPVPSSMAGPGWVRPKGMTVRQSGSSVLTDWETFERASRPCCATIGRNICTTRPAAFHVTVRLSFMASPGAANADTRWPYAIRAVASTFAITCASSTTSQSASVCARRRSTEAWRPPFWQQSPPPKSTLGLARKRRSVNPTRPCVAPRCNRSIVSATRPVSRRAPIQPGRPRQPARRGRTRAALGGGALGASPC